MAAESSLTLMELISNYGSQPLEGGEIPGRAEDVLCGGRSTTRRLGEATRVCSKATTYKMPVTPINSTKTDRVPKVTVK